LTRAAEALAIIASGHAWTILIAATIPSRPREVALRTIEDPGAVTTVSIAWRPSAHVAHREALIQTTLALRDRGSLTTDSPDMSAPPADGRARPGHSRGKRI
jgi:hypothetical protein